MGSGEVRELVVVASQVMLAVGVVGGVVDVAGKSDAVMVEALVLL